jgi:hypothetical protein
MDYIPCRERYFPLRINIVSFYTTYLKWFRHLIERLGLQNTLSIWKSAFEDHDDKYLMRILNSGWRNIASNGDTLPDKSIDKMAATFFPTADLGLSSTEARSIIEKTPPITQIKQLFSIHTMEKEMTTYDALHLRFDGLARLAESLIDKYGKQGELIVYDLMVEGRLASGKGETGSVEEFIENFTAKPDKSTLFTAGLEIELISKSKREAAIYVRECEWARYFQEYHPQVGYLMACSTDEVAYKAFNPSLRMQRTLTIMEGDKMCDFRVCAIDEKPYPE